MSNINPERANPKNNMNNEWLTVKEMQDPFVALYDDEKPVDHNRSLLIGFDFIFGGIGILTCLLGINTVGVKSYLVLSGLLGCGLIVVGIIRQRRP